MSTTRRAFLERALWAGAALPASAIWGAAAAPDPPPLATRFPDLRRRFVFEYYPWYGVDPYVHWDLWDRVPPSDIAATSVPRLGPYDVRSRAVLERQARWIAETGVGSVNLSWWGPGSFEDRAVPLLMDVFRDHDLRVTFHLEPYANDRGRHYAEDVLYLLREYGEKRRFDALLLLRAGSAPEGPVFKSFRTILPETSTDCHGVTERVSDYTPDDEWRRQTDTLRRTLRHDFPHLTLLADSLGFSRVRQGGFDGIAIFDNFVPPSSYPTHAAGASRQNLLFSFNVNPGYDTIEPRQIGPDSCYRPSPFDPPAEGLDFRRAEDRERAAELSAGRIRESLERTLAVQQDPALINARKDFFLVYLNSFNEWHEGTSFEPGKDAADLRLDERVLGYHNPARGDYRLAALTSLLQPVLG